MMIMKIGRTRLDEWIMEDDHRPAEMVEEEEVGNHQRPEEEDHRVAVGEEEMVTTVAVTVMRKRQGITM